MAAALEQSCAPVIRFCSQHAADSTTEAKTMQLLMQLCNTVVQYSSSSANAG